MFDDNDSTILVPNGIRSCQLINGKMQVTAIGASAVSMSITPLIEEPALSPVAIKQMSIMADAAIAILNSSRHQPTSPPVPAPKRKPSHLSLVPK